MSSSIPLDTTQLFKSIFMGREDVFAVRWEKALFNASIKLSFYLATNRALKSTIRH